MAAEEQPGNGGVEIASENIEELPEEYRPREVVSTHETLLDRFYTAVTADWLRISSLSVIVIVFIMAIFAPIIAPYDPGASYDLRKPPMAYSVTDVDADGEDERILHPLGTDSLGQDVLSRIIFGSRISLMVGFSTVAFAAVVGIAIGLVAGFYGGWIDNLLMRYIDFQWAFPEIIIAIGIIAFIGGLGVMNVILAIGIAYFDDFARLVRGEVLRIREEEYVMAAKAMGMRNRTIMAREILPNAVAAIIVQATVMIPLAILAEAGLSFLGLGVTPTTPTWGLLISDGRGYITTSWWISVMPGLAIMFTALSFNIIGDGLRDTFDVTELDR